MIGEPAEFGGSAARGVRATCGFVRARVGGVEVELHGERAVCWREGDLATVFVADTHFGKAASFRAAGVPVPSGTTARDLDRLSGLLERTGARRLVVLGDLLHAREGRQDDTMGAIGAWRARHGDLEVVLVRGNHDVRAGDPPREWDVRCVDEGFGLGGFVLCHDPAFAAGAVKDGAGGPIALAGHVHPAVVVGDRRGARGRFPAFVCEPAGAVREAGSAGRCGERDGVVLTLPAFGSFTGGKAVGMSRFGRAWAVVDGEVVEVPRGVVGG
ncbi:MAG: ligase-associated DNA damage response endonuclease PdeM [Phycisphaerales bacterium]